MPPVKSIEFDYAINGTKELQQALLSLGKSTARNVVRRALLAGASVVRDKARELAPRETGALKRSIVAQTNRRRSKSEVIVAEVKIDRKAFRPQGNGKFKVIKTKGKTGQKRYQKGDRYPRNYAHLVEYGTAPHNVGKGGKGGMSHPGARPKPFMRPAFDSTRMQAFDTISKRVLSEIEKEVIKARPTRRTA